MQKRPSRGPTVARGSAGAALLLWSVWATGCAWLHLGYHESLRPGEPAYAAACDCSLAVPSREWVRDIPEQAGHALDLAHESGDVRIGVRVYPGTTHLDELQAEALDDHRMMLPNGASTTGRFAFPAPDGLVPAVVVHSCGVLVGWSAWGTEQCLVNVFATWSERTYEISVVDVGFPNRSAEIDAILRSFRLGRAPADPPL